MNAERLRRILGATKNLQPPSCIVETRHPVETRPECTFAAVLEERLRFMAIDLGETKTRVNVLIWTVAGAIVVTIIMDLIK